MSKQILLLSNQLDISIVDCEVIWESARLNLLNELSNSTIGIVGPYGGLIEVITKDQLNNMEFTIERF